MLKELHREDLSIVQNISTNEITIYHHNVPIYRMVTRFLLKKDELCKVVEYFRTAQFAAIEMYL